MDGHVRGGRRRTEVDLARGLFGDFLPPAILEGVQLGRSRVLWVPVEDDALLVGRRGIVGLRSMDDSNVKNTKEGREVRVKRK